MSDLAIVTGSTGGLGGAIVQRLLAEGYQVLACGRDPAKIQRLVDTSVLGTVHPLSFDIGHCEAWTMSVEGALAQHGPPALLVCAHGAAPCVKPTLALTVAEVAEVWRTDVLGTLLACQTVGRVMLAQRRGAIVLVSSLHSQVTYPQRTAYSLAKSALSGLVRSLALEWGGAGVRTNAVLPWQVRGPRSDAFIARHRAETGEDLRELYQDRSPMRRLLEPEEVADAVLFLARNPACNGMELVLDGGVSQSMWYLPYQDRS